MRGLGENAQMLFRQLGIGHGDELLFDFQLAGNIAEPADNPALRLTFLFFLAALIKRLQARTNQREEQNCTRDKFHEAP